MSAAVALPDPPLPVQVSVKLTAPVVVGDSDFVPLVDCAPLHPPLAVHAVVLVELQVTVAACPTVIVVGATAIVTVGAGVVTVSAAVALALPPVPVQGSDVTYCPRLLNDVVRPFDER
jgi:hypothetical protein